MKVYYIPLYTDDFDLFKGFGIIVPGLCMTLFLLNTMHLLKNRTLRRALYYLCNVIVFWASVGLREIIRNEKPHPDYIVKEWFFCGSIYGLPAADYSFILSWLFSHMILEVHSIGAIVIYFLSMSGISYLYYSTRQLSFFQLSLSFLWAISLTFLLVLVIESIGVHFKCFTRKKKHAQKNQYIESEEEDE
jgi:hypothetical protein